MTEWYEGAGVVESVAGFVDTLTGESEGEGVDVIDAAIGAAGMVVDLVGSAESHDRSIHGRVPERPRHGDRSRGRVVSLGLRSQPLHELGAPARNRRPQRPRDLLALRLRPDATPEHRHVDTQRSPR